MDAHSQMIMDEFLENYESYEIIRDVVLERLKKLIKENNISVTAIEGRVKEKNSLEGKLNLKGYKYSGIADLTDIFGARIITFYTEDVDKIASLIEQEFDVDWENSVDKRSALSDDQFGYMSLHYICRIPKSVYYDEAHPMVNEYRFEIQMRTTLQHVWATAYHDTGYKSNIEVPKEYIRALNRLAGLLEIADQEFSSINKELTAYRRKVQTLVKDNRFDDLELNGETFKSYISIEPFKLLNAKIASINKAEIQQQSFMPYLEVFVRLGFKTIADIEKMKKECESDAYRLAVLQLGNTDLDILSETIGLQNLCIAYILKQGGGLLNLKEFLDTLYGQRERNITSAARLLSQAKSLNLYKEEI